MASDRITVDGMPVLYCYREPPDHDDDSGWRFFAGDESEEYVENASNFGTFDVNTVANYDNAIVSILAAEEGTAWERTSGTEPFTRSLG